MLKHKQNIKSRCIEYSLLLCLGLLLMQPIFAQDDETVCADTDRGDSTRDIDADDDGLIEVCYLEDLNAIRYQLDGSGYKVSATAAKITNGCDEDGAAVCIGYELMRDLDFEAGDSYVSTENKVVWTVDNFETNDGTDTGWHPIGNVFSLNCSDARSNCFSSIFEGNGKRISNLQINRDTATYVGLFRANIGSIRNIELANPEVEVIGRNIVGALVAFNQRHIINSGVVGGFINATGNSIGGLIGINGRFGGDNTNVIIINSYVSGSRVNGFLVVGGVCASNEGRIINSYADVTVRGTGLIIGGLAGRTRGSEVSADGIVNSYVTGSVSGAHSGQIRIGGLLGDLLGTAIIANSYSTARVVNGDGLISSSGSGNINDNYWDTVTSRQATSAGGGTGKTSSELQSPIAATGIYANWSNADWDFGNTMSYPALRYNNADDVDACDSDPDTPLPRCGKLLPNQPGRDSGLSALYLVAGGTDLDAGLISDKLFSSLVYEYNLNVSFIETFQLEPHAINDSASVSIIKNGEDPVTDYFGNKLSGERSIAIPFQAESSETLKIIVKDVDPPTTSTYIFNARVGTTTSVEVISFSNIPAAGGTVDEGDDITLNAEFDFGSGIYEYSLQRAGDEIAQGVSTASAAFTMSIPDDFVDAARTTQNIVFTITVNDGFSTITADLILIVNKTNKDGPQFELSVSPATLRIDAVAADPDGAGTFAYQWQQRDAGDPQWIDPASNTGASYTVPANTSSTMRYRVLVNHRDGQGYPRNWNIGSFPVDIDGDDNGLIDIYYLEDLDVVRHQSDGSGYQISAVPNGVTADTITAGCPLIDGVMTCAGYEMLRDLDFAMDDSYVDATTNRAQWTVDDFGTAGDTGWLPIGDEADPFNTVLDGNNYFISNLQINRDTATDGHIGLFGVLSGDARIENMGLLDVNIEGKGDVGSLVAENKGTIINSYAEGGTVLGTQHSLGGLVAINGDGNDVITVGGVIVNSYANVETTSTDVPLVGGLVGSNRGMIRNSYAAGNARGSCDVGGLVGENRSSASGRSQVINSYASGDVRRLGSCTNVARNRASGLVALNEGLISNSLARGQIIGGGGSVGGVVAVANEVNVAFPAEVEYSYFDSTVNGGITAGAGDGLGKTTNELIMPMAAGTTTTEIYYQWSTDDWDFGTIETYPLLRYTDDVESSDAMVCNTASNTELPLCGGLLRGQHDKRLSGIVLFANDVPVDESAFDKAFSYSVLDYAVSVEDISTIRLAPYASNARNSFISIIRGGGFLSLEYFGDKRSGEQSDAILMPLGETINLIVRVGNSFEDPDPVVYSFTVNNTISPVEVIDITSTPSSLRDEGEAITLSATIKGGIPSDYSYQWSSDLLDLSRQDTTAATLNFNMPTDFVPSEDANRSAVFKLIVTDGVSESSATKIVTIVRASNGDPSFIPRVTPSEISIVIEDPDGGGMAEYAWEQRGIGDTSWAPIPGATRNTYRVLPEARGDTRYRVRISNYIDAQGYPSASVSLAPLRADIDDDGDNLIDIYYLEDLDKVRHQLDGTGYKENDTADKITAGCAGTCNGYEMIRDLDFTAAQSYILGEVNKDWTVDDFNNTSDTGWDPIGSLSSRNCNDVNNNCFSGIFEGNGKRISNLQINRDSADYVGLFAGNSGSIRSIGLVEPEIEGERIIGVLVGFNQGTSARQATIINSNVVGVDGRVKGSNDNIGGLVGINQANAIIVNSYASVNIEGSFWIGGLVGTNRGRITNSYATGNVAGKGASASRTIGGLVGDNGSEASEAAIIENCYALGDVSSERTADGDVRLGGLVGIAWQKSTVSDSYAIGNVKVARSTAGIGTFGGLVGTEADQSDAENNSVVENSYWNNVTSSRTMSRGGTGKTTVELQAPTMATGIYADWSASDWDFGTPQTYPVLRYNNVASVEACDLDPNTALPRCGTLLSGQPGRDSGLNALLFRVNDINLNNATVFGSQLFSFLRFNYTVEIPYTTAFQLRPYAVSNDANISIRQAGDDTNYFTNKSSGDLSEVISLPRENAPTTVTIVVADANPISYHFVVRRAVPDITLDITNPADRSTVDEGDTITATVGGSNSVYSYLLESGEMKRTEGLDSGATLSLDIPEDLSFAGNATTQRIVFTLLVNNGRNEAEAEIELIVTKQNNGNPQLELSVNPATLRIDVTEDDPDGAGTFAYQWQQRDAGDPQWTLASNTSESYTVPANTSSTMRYRVLVNHRDGQGYPRNWNIGPFPVDIDGDDNGLIDIYYLEDLDVVRHQSDGNGYQISAVPNGVTADTITAGCPLIDGVMTCAGYEMLRDLDFAMDDSYVDATTNTTEWTVDDFGIAGDTGWLPIGDEAEPFNTVLDGNNYFISNLQINRDTAADGHIGLFGVLSGDARIENMGLLDVNIQGRGDVGSLVAENKGTIINSYVEGGVVWGTQHSLGGLVAINGDGNDTITIGGVIVNSYANVATTSTNVLAAGGLVGSNRGTIRNSYAASNARGSCDVGGLVGENRSSASGRSQIINSYASGDVRRLGSCTNGTRNRASGLVALNEGLINNSLARGQIISDGGSIGGVVAYANEVSDDFLAEVGYSYFDSTVNGGITASADDGISKTREELMMPMAAGAITTEIYYQWSTADWDFGTTQTYPLLRYTGNVEGSDAVACDDASNAELPLCGGLLPGQHDERLKGLSGILFFAGNALLNESVFDKAFSSLALNYDMSVEEISTIRLAPYAINPRNSFISIIKDGESPSTNYFAGKRNGEQSEAISVSRGETNLMVRVGNTPDDPDTGIYHFTVNNKLHSVGVIDITSVPASSVDEGEAIILSATLGGGDPSNYRYQWSSDLLDLSGQDTTTETLSFNIPIDFVPSGESTKRVVFTLTVTDGDSVSSATGTVTIVKVNNGDPSFTARVTTSTISIAVMGEDPDGNGVSSYVWEQRSIGDADWKEIDNESNTYTILPQARSDTRYRVRVRYTDAQDNVTNKILGPYRLRADIDDDDDGLIDIYYLEDLDKVRYQLDGSGYKESDTADKITAGCSDNTCIGYELRRDLDFSTTQSYINVENKVVWTVDNFDAAGDTGWLPIGNIVRANCRDASSNCFNSIFEGNGKRISNLQINRDTAFYVGLFRANIGSIRNIELVNPEVEVIGQNLVGALAAFNQRRIINSGVVGGFIKATRNSIGGLIGKNGRFEGDNANAIIINSYVSGSRVNGGLLVGGVCASNEGRIINSYADVTVIGTSLSIGGLAGRTRGSEASVYRIVNSYATGFVSTTRSGQLRVGGLFGDLLGTAIIANSYSTARVVNGGRFNQ